VTITGLKYFVLRDYPGGRRELRNLHLHDLYPSPIVSRFNKLRRMSWVGHVARRGQKSKGLVEFFGGGKRFLNERYRLEDLGLNGRIILK